MKVSLNAVKQYIDFELPSTTDLVKRINEQLGGVEQVIDLAAKYKDVVIVKVISAEQHPNADRLKVTKIDDGGVVKDVERDENGYVQVVCGAPNARAGIIAAWLPPKSTVPASFDDEQPFVLSARELRGVVSQGMLAAGDELAINSDHDGIIEIDPDEWRPYNVEIKPGASFAAAYGLDDTIIDIENKMFTHRPDLFGQIGVARELAGIYGEQFEEKDWYWSQPGFESASGLELTVFNEANDKVPRIMFVAMKDIEVKPSPLWLQCALVTMGGKPINNIVDVTNYIMLLTAQPTHAYDYDKIRGATIGARMAKAGEKIELLNGKSYELTEDDIVIADGEGAIGLGGIMGGGNSEVSPDTKNIILEVATFDMYAARKSSMRHGIFTDALTRFNKGQSPLQNDRIINLLMMSIKDMSQAQQASEVFDLRSKSLKSAYDAQSLSGTLKVKASFINDRLGLTLSEPEIEQILRNVRFACYVDKGDTAISITAPYWRTDIELPEDIVEEVGRLYGFDKLPHELPMRSAKPTPKNESRRLKQLVRQSLKSAGASEVLTYSFVHEKMLQKAGQNKDDAFRLSNALSPDLQYYRLSLLPSLLDKVHGNIRNGFDEFALYEIGKGHNKNDYEGELPAETELVELIYAAKQSKQGAPFYQVRRLLDQLCNDLGIEVAYRSIGEAMDYVGMMPFEKDRSAIVETRDGQVLGVIGELKATVRKAFKLPDYSAAMSLSFDAVLNARRQVSPSYAALSRFPSVTQDISLQVGQDIEYVAVADSARETAIGYDDTLAIEMAPISVYQPDGEETKTITLRFTVTSHEKTLTDQEVRPILEAVAKNAKQQLKANVV